MPRIKVGLNSRLLAESTMRGWTRYTTNLIRALAQTGHAEISLLTDRSMAAEHRTRLSESINSGAIQEIASGPMAYPKWQEFWLPQVIKSNQIDVYHTPYHYGIPWRAGCPTVATLHDAIDANMVLPWPERFSRVAMLSRYYLWQTRKLADLIITVSHFSAGELNQSLKIPRQKIRVVYEAADPVFEKLAEAREIAEVTQRYAVSQSPYVFYVGGLEARKNFEVVLHAMAKMEQKSFFQLVLAGGSAEDRRRLTELAQALSIETDVKFIGKVPDVDLPALYAGARALIYPSRLEGFGLQLVEAMACGCPLLVSHATSLPEIAGEAAAYFEPDDSVTLASILDRLAVNQDFAAGLKRWSIDRSRHFSWSITASETLAVFNELAAI